MSQTGVHHAEAAALKLEEGDTPNMMTEAPPAKVEPVLEAKVGSIVELFIGRAQVRAVREDGMLELVALGWEMKREQRPRYYVRKESVKVVPTVYYKMSVLEQLHMAAWLKEEGGRLFMAAEYQAAAESFIKAVEVLSTCNFTTNTQIARALEIMYPCHNNAATCYIKIKSYADARLLSENVDRLYSALKRNRSGLVVKALKGRGVGETMLWEWWQMSMFLNGKACIFQCRDDFDAMSLEKELTTPTARSKRLREITLELSKSTESLASKMIKLEQLLPANGQPIPQLSILERIAQLAGKDDVAVSPKKTHGEDTVEEQAKEDKKEQEAEAKGKKKQESEGEKGHKTALPVKILLRGTLVVGVIATYIVGIVVLGRRR